MLCVTGMLLITHAFTETPSHRDAFAQGCFHTHRNDFLHTNTFTERWFYIERIYTEMPKQTEALLQRNAFTRGAFAYRRFYAGILSPDFRTADVHFAPRVQQADAKPQFHHSFNDRDAFREKGRFEHNQNYNFTVFSTIDTHLAQELTQHHPHRCNFGGPGRDACRGKTSANPHCNFAPIFDDRHFVRAGCVSRTLQVTLGR